MLSGPLRLAPARSACKRLTPAHYRAFETWQDVTRSVGVLVIDSKVAWSQDVQGWHKGCSAWGMYLLLGLVSSLAVGRVDGVVADLQESPGPAVPSLCTKWPRVAAWVRVVSAARVGRREERCIF